MLLRFIVKLSHGAKRAYRCFSTSVEVCSEPLQFYCSCYIYVERNATTSNSTFLLVFFAGNFFQFTARQSHTNWQIKHTYIQAQHAHTHTNTHPTRTTFEHFSLVSEALWHAHSREWYKAKIWLDFPTKLKRSDKRKENVFWLSFYICSFKQAKWNKIGVFSYICATILIFIWAFVWYF